MSGLVLWEVLLASRVENKELSIKTFPILKWKTRGSIERAVQISKRWRNPRMMEMLQRSRMDKMGSAEGCLSHCCEKEYVLEEEVGTNGINGEEGGDSHSDGELSHGDSDYNED